MALLNYTSKIDADKTAAEIAKILSMHGASAVMTEYDQDTGVVTSISFKIKMGEQSVGFRLPCDPKPVYEVITKGKQWKGKEWFQNYKKLKSDAELQAVRTAWRIVKDWVEAQCALIETKMVTTSQVFLPYAITKDGKTLAEKVAENPAMLLGDGT